MKKVLNNALVILIILITLSMKVHASENESITNGSEIIIANKYAERYCSAKVENFFEGLENEKTLKYSYFKYVGLQSEELFSKDINTLLINQIKENCNISISEEKELNEYLFNKS